MSQSQGMSGDVIDDDAPEEIPDHPQKFPALTSLFHFLWLRKWWAVSIWLLLSIPTGLFLSIHDLPKSYTTTTVLRFPSVVGAQTNVMRDIAITQGESILSVFNSFQVLEATVRKLGLRMRIVTPRVFQREVIKSVNYTESLGLGDYILKAEGGKRLSITYRPRGTTAEYPIFRGAADEGRVSVSGLDLVLTPQYFATQQGRQLTLHFRNMEETIEDLKKSLGTRALGASNFEIKLKDRDPFLVADILNVLREQFLDVYYGTTEVQDVGILAQMEKDLDLAKQRLEKSQDDVSKYYAVHPELARADAPNPGDNLSYLEARQQIELLQQRKNRVQTAMAAKDLSATGEKKFFWASELLQAMSEAGEPKANILRASLGELNTRQAGFRQTLGPEHPKIAEVEKEKEDLYRQAEEAEGELMRRIDKELGESKMKFVATAPSNAPRVAVKVQLELERLNAVNTNNQQIYDRLQESYNRAKLTTGSEFFKVTVVDPARPAPYQPPSIRARLAVAVGAVLLLMLLVPASFLGWPILFIKIWTKEDVNRLLGLRFLGAVRLRKKPAPAAAGKSSPPKPAVTMPGGATPIKGADPLLLFFGDSYGLEDVEAFRIIREETENTFRSPTRPGKYCLMVTSCHPHEGKSTCASNLAMTLARKGKRTLLVDADFRLGRIDRIFNLEVHTGIDDVLGQQDLTLPQFLETVPMAFQTTPQRNLIIAPRRSQNPNAGEMVSSDRFKAFIKLVKDQFDVVIIDTPPVLITPEPLSLAEVTDGVIFVCRSGVTAASEAREAVATLHDRKVRIAVILNGVRDTFFARSRYKKYSYYYQVQSKPGVTAEE
jgi:capsular exopolysaccharide synthesis family protein